MENGLIIFDCDGVLLDSELLSCQVDATILKNFGINLSAQAIITDFAGTSVEIMLSSLSKRYKTSINPIDYHKLKNDLESSLESPSAVDGAQQGLERLITSSRQICVASSSSAHRLRINLDNAFPKNYFGTAIYSSDQVNEAKPAPDLFLFAAKQHSTDAKDCLVVEDSENGVRAAIAAQMPVIGFVGASHCDERQGARLIHLGAHKVFDNYSDMISFIAEWHIN